MSLCLRMHRPVPVLRSIARWPAARAVVRPCSLPIRTFATPPADVDTPVAPVAIPPQQLDEGVLLYRFRHIQLLRIFARAKVLQVGGALSLTHLLFVDLDDTVAVAQALALFGGAGLAIATLQWLTRRLACELRLQRLAPEEGDGAARGQLTLSTLSFWGTRVDDTFSLARLQSPLAELEPAQLRASLGHTPFFTLGIAGEDRPILLSMSPRFSDLQKVGPTEFAALMECLRHTVPAGWDAATPAAAAADRE